MSFTILRESHDAYLSNPAIGRSSIWTVASKTLGHWVGEEPKESDAMDFGTLVHTLVLEPDTFGQRYRVGPAGVTRATKIWKDAELNATADGLLLIKPDDHAKAEGMAAVARAHPVLGKVLEQSDREIEHSYYWRDEETGLMLKARPDLVSPGLGIVLDYKTSRDASPRWFAKACASYGYHLQDPHYMDGVTHREEMLDGTFVFAVQETEAPYAIGLYEIGKDDFAKGHALIRRTLRQMEEAIRLDKFPLYSEEVVTIAIPEWAFKDEEEGQE